MKEQLQTLRKKNLSRRYDVSAVEKDTMIFTDILIDQRDGRTVEYLT